MLGPNLHKLLSQAVVSAPLAASIIVVETSTPQEVQQAWHCIGPGLASYAFFEKEDLLARAITLDSRAWGFGSHVDPLEAANRKIQGIREDQPMQIILDCAYQALSVLIHMDTEDGMMADALAEEDVRLLNDDFEMASGLFWSTVRAGR